MVLYVIFTIVIALLLLNAKKGQSHGSSSSSSSTTTAKPSVKKSSSSSSSSSSSESTPAPTKPTCPDCPNTNGCCGGDACGRKFCPPLVPSSKPGCKPECKKLIFNENFKNFQDKLNSGNWSQLVVQDPTNPLATITINDGRIIQECDGAVFDSRIFSTVASNPFPVDDFHYGVVKSIPYSPSKAGYCMEFTVSEMTKYTRKVQQAPGVTPWGIFYECTGADPEADYRLAGSSVGILSTDAADDTFFIRVVMAKKHVYLTYGIENLITNRRDRFAASIPLFARAGNMDEKFTFVLSLNWDGSFQLFQRLHNDCSYKCLLYVPNVGIPPSDRKYIVKSNSRTFTVGGAAPVVIYEPFTVTTTEVTIMNTSNFDYMEPLSEGVPKTALYQVDPAVAPTDTPLRYLCDCDSALRQAEAVTTLPTADAVNTLPSHFGQGATVKVYNLEVCYI